MIFDKQGTTTTVFQEDISLKSFIQNIEEAYENLENDNLILNLFSFIDLSADDILEFLQLSNKHRVNSKSFVLVTDKVTFDEAPEELCVVPTLQEAKDFIEMEEIERDLGL